jgi:hypothetical protein
VRNGFRGGREGQGQQVEEDEVPTLRKRRNQGGMSRLTQEEDRAFSVRSL